MARGAVVRIWKQKDLTLGKLSVALVNSRYKLDVIVPKTLGFKE